MRLLSIETSGHTWSIAVQDTGKVLGSSSHPEPQKAASFLMPMIQQLLEKAHLTFQDLEGIAVARGPGSFTGIRVGMSTARGLSFALKCPLFAVDNFEIVYRTLSEKKRQKEAFYILLDTRGSILCLRYFPPSPEKPQAPLYGTAPEIASFLRGKTEKILGDGLDRLEAFWEGLPLLVEKEGLENRAVSLGQYVLTRDSDPLFLECTPLYGPELSLAPSKDVKKDG